MAPTNPSTSQPEGPTIKELAAQLDLLADSETLRLLAELYENQDNPNYIAPTVGDLFNTQRGLYLNGQLFDPTIEGLSELPLAYEDFKGPARAAFHIRQQMERIVGRAEKAQQDFLKRSFRKVRAKVRTTPGGTKQNRQYNQTEAIQELRPFAWGTPNNRLVFSKRGTKVHLGVKFDGTLSPPTDIDAEVSVLPSQEDSHLQQLFQDKLAEYADTILDHTHSFVVTAGSVMGHDRVDRTLKLTLLANIEGQHYRTFYRVENGKIAPNSRLERVDVDEDGLDENSLQITGSLDYSMRVARAKLDELADYLGYVEDLAVFRNVFSDDVDLDNLLDEDDEEDLDESPTPEELDDGHDEEMVDGPVDRDAMLRQEPRASLTEVPYEELEARVAADVAEHPENYPEPLQELAAEATESEEDAPDLVGSMTKELLMTEEPDESVDDSPYWDETPVATSGDQEQEPKREPDPVEFDFGF